MKVMPRPFKVMLSDKAAKVLGEIAAQLKSERNNYQIGVGTISAELLEHLIAARPDLIQQLLDTGDIVSEESGGSVKTIPPLKKGRGEKRRKAA